MLSPHDAQVVRRDPALPGLATLLDPAAFLAALGARLPNAELRRAVSNYVRYKPGTSCLAAYRIESAGGEAVDAYAKAYRPDDQAKVRKRLDAPGVATALGPGPFLLDDVAVLVCPFPNDAEVEALPALADRQGRADLLRRVLPDRPNLWDGDLRPLAYKPERRYVGRLDLGGEPRAAVKLYSGSGFGRMSRSAKLLGSRGTLRVPRRLGRSERHCVLALEWLPGRPLLDVLAAPALDAGAVEAVGAAVAELHAQGGSKLEVLSRASEAAGLLALAEALAALLGPPWDRDVQAIGDRLTGWLTQRPPPAACTHGDFHPKQVVIGGDDGNTVGLLDTDEAVRGDPAADAGGFLAHVELYALTGRLPADRVEPVRAALWRGYRSAGGAWDDQGIDGYTAVGLLRLAPNLFRGRDPEWPARTSAVMGRAAAYLRRGGGNVEGAGTAGRDAT